MWAGGWSVPVRRYDGRVEVLVYRSANSGLIYC